jgi:glycosyltransferase involved in cell wall biosynthesis
MVSKIVVSIVMGVFNEEKLIARALKSIINQTYIDWELIVVDDGSTDSSREIIKSYASQDNRIILVENKTNLGLAASLNSGISIARGKYIARMDADDESLPHRLERQTAFLDLNPNVDVLGTAAVYIDSRGHTIKKVFLAEWHEDILARMLRTCPVIHPSVMMRREFIEMMGGYDNSTRRAEDHDLWLRARGMAKFHNLPEIHLRYLVSSKLMFVTIFDRVLVRLKHSYSISEYVASIFWSILDLLALLRQRLKVIK